MPNGTVVIADTDNDRLVILERLDGGWVRSRRSIDGIALRRPHYVLFNPHDLHLYVLDARGLYRVRSPFGRGEAWRIEGSRLGYARSLTLLDARVHVVASSRGTVLRIDDFSERRLRSFLSHGKRSVAPAGAWSTTGLVLNDVTQVDGWYYGTNYFSPDYAEHGDARPLRLFRWRTWTDFRRGQWQDLSACVPPGLVPYFFTTTGGQLCLSAFCHADHRRDGIFTLTP